MEAQSSNANTALLDMVESYQTVMPKSNALERQSECITDV